MKTFSKSINPKWSPDYGDGIRKPPLSQLRRLLALCLFIAVSALSASAQEGLAVDNVFRLFGHSKGCKMVVMKNAKLQGYRLATYKSLTYGNQYATAIATYLKTDRRAAKKIREIVDDGRVASGYYMMHPLSSGANRYILFSHTVKGKGAVIYIEGNLSPDDIMTICYARRM